MVAQVKPGQHALFIGQGPIELHLGDIEVGKAPLVPGHGAAEPLGVGVVDGLVTQLDLEPVAQLAAAVQEAPGGVLEIVPVAPFVLVGILQPGMLAVPVVGQSQFAAVPGVRNQAVARIAEDAILADEPGHVLGVVDHVPEGLRVAADAKSDALHRLLRKRCAPH